MRIGIIFGGQSREREISFAGGRTVFDNLNKTLFTPVPIFIDSLGNFILLDWKYLYKGTIRDFYPTASSLPESPHFFQIYAESLQENQELINQSIAEVGEKIAPEELSKHIDFAFLTLHGPYGEDGNIQGMLEWFGIPYSGAGILSSSIGIDKAIQKRILADAGFDTPDYLEISREEWMQQPTETQNRIKEKFSFPVVVKSPHQGSSIGVSVVKDIHELAPAIFKSFFVQKIATADWRKKTDTEKRVFLVKFTDIREGLGFPVYFDQELIYHPEVLWVKLDQTDQAEVTLTSPNGESSLIIEEFIEGQEFSCIVIENGNGKPMALPPTEIRKASNLFDYRSKYLPGISRKITPIDISEELIDAIRAKSEALFSSLQCDVYARLDGFLTSDHKIFLNDPNTTSGMLPSSFFFHQAAEIGLAPSQFLTYIIERSLIARKRSGKHIFHLDNLLQSLNQSMKKAAMLEEEKIRVGVIMGGFSTERHISVESGRNIFEKLASSSKYLPVPIFLTGDESQHEMYQIPVNVMLKDNADDIKEKVRSKKPAHSIISKIKEEAKAITEKYAFEGALALRALSYDDLKDLMDFVFIALHGRPGEDGAVQVELEARDIPYNGSGVESSRISINKFETNELLAQHGILVAKHRMVEEADYRQNQDQLLTKIEADYGYPIIAKPADDGCSSAVKKIKNREELIAFCEMMFRPSPDFPKKPQKILNLRDNEEFPQKRQFLIEELISANGAEQFLEITGGMLTHFEKDGTLKFEVFEPSEALASGEVLSLEEKFLAGEGQNITPARFGTANMSYEKIAEEVKNTLEKTARVVGVEGYCRIDAFVRVFADKVETIVIEINSLPGMTPATAIFHQTALNHMKPYEFIDQIISFGRARQKMLKGDVG